MKNRLNLILGLVALFLLCGLLYWQKKPSEPAPSIPIQKDGAPPSAPASIIATTPAEPLPAAATPPQPNTLPSGNAVPKRKFSEMEMEEAAPILEEIRGKDIAAIFQAFLDAMRVEQDGMKVNGVLNALEYALRDRKPNPEFLKILRGFIEDASNSELERGMVIGALSMAATKETGELLIDLVARANLKEKRVREAAISGILGLVREAGNEEFAPEITRIWKETTNTSEMHDAAMAMARSGAPASIELLLEAALAPTGKGEDVRRGMWAMEALLSQVITENAVPPLAAMLKKSPVGTPANELAFQALSRMVDDKADQALLKWLQTTDSSAAPLAKAWVADAQTRELLNAAKAALNPKVPFRSEANRQALRDGIKAHDATMKEMARPKRIGK